MPEPTREDFEFIARAARACAENATSLCHEAKLLLSAGFHARAVALAISSLEEDGKQTALLRVEIEFAPDFREALGRRSHEVMQHKSKQRNALQSIKFVYGGIPILNDVLQIKPPDPELAGLADGVNEEIYEERERALYVGLAQGEIQSPLAAVSQGTAEKYVRLATAAAFGRDWLTNTPVSTIAEFLERYRAIWLENPVTAKDDPAKAALAFKRIRDQIFSEFQVIADDRGAFVKLEKN